MATALVLFMTLPGLALFYAGLVRSKNVLSVLMHCIAIACLASVVWLVAGYSIAFGTDTNAWWGGLSKVFLKGVGTESLSGDIPENVFFMFQMTFAIITRSSSAPMWSGSNSARYCCSVVFGCWWSMHRPLIGFGAAGSWPTWVGPANRLKASR